MDRPSRRALTVTAALVGATVIGALVGAGTFAALDDSSSVVREVTVDGSEPTTEADGLSASQVYERSYRAVVEITATTPFGDASQRAQGSGFVYDADGHVITNQHVVSGEGEISVRFWNGSTYDADIVGTDPSTDLAVLKVKAPASILSPLRVADSNGVDVGDTVFALGSPFGLEGSFTAGIVSALHREMRAPNRFTIANTIQTDAAINHGNSGGPLLDDRGRVVGVNAQIESESGGSDGVGFAIPSNTVRSVAAQLIQNGEAEHAYLGVGIQAVPDGVAITQVRSDTPAEDAGLQEATGTTIVDGQEVPTGGDVIVEVDGEPVTTAGELQSAIDAKRPGDTLTLTLLRDGERRTVEVTLAVRPARIS